MSSIRVSGNTSGYYDLTVPDVAGTNTIPLNQVVTTDANGNLGIGTTTPTFATIDTYTQRGIEISGAKETGTAPVIRLTETGSGKGSFEIRSNREGSTSGNYLAFGEAADTFMVIRGDDDGGGTARRGNVGIGATNPFNKLQIGDGAVGGLEDALGILTHYGNHNTALGKIRWHDGNNVTGQIHTQYDGTSVDMHFGHLYYGNYDTNSDLIIKGNGCVVTPNQPFVMVDFGGPATYATMQGVAPFDNIVQSQGNHYSTTSYRFTCPVTGVYQISSGFISQSASDQYHVSYQKNGVRISRNYTTYRTNQTSMLIKCAAGDYLDINLEDSLGYYQGTGTDRYCWATYMLVG